ncbi:MAG: ABC transporter ATP-binding protein [Clostridia bacterium]
MNKKTSMYKDWKRYFPVIFSYKKSIITITLLMITAAVIDVLVPLFSSFCVDYFIEPKQDNGLMVFGIVAISLMIIQAITTVFMAKLAITVEMKIGQKIKNMLFTHLQTLSFDYYNSTPVGTIVARVMSDTAKIGEMVAWGFVDIAWAGASIIGYIIAMCIIDINLALLIIAVVPAIAILTLFFQRKILIVNREVRTINAEITRGFNEGISGAKTSKTLVIEENNVDSFKTVTEKMKNKSLHAVLLNAIYIPLIAVLTSISVALILNSGSNMVLDGNIELWKLTAFINYALVIGSPVQQLARTISNFVATHVNVERCNFMLDLKPQIHDSEIVEEKYGTVFNPKKENWEEITGHITFDDVTFMYSDGTENVLEHFNLDIPAGTTVALVGETGAGKSTLVNLACRFFEPTCGRVLFDGIDYKERSTLWLHSNIGYVLQTPHLFSGSIKENIRYGKLDATDDEVIAAAKIVSAHDSIMRMEKGYDSDVGEGGDQLSTGEKQLISFARAVLADPKIFVLDEATASIDTKTEELIQNAIGKLLGTRTSFLIAHRLSTIRKADIILVVKGGKIIERGTHISLLEKGGYYADLYNKQFENEATNRILG